MDITKHYIENTELTLQQIADTIGSTYKRVYRVWKTYPNEFRKSRKVNSYRKSKLGDLNPMTGKRGTDHPNYKGVVADGKGYLMVLKPTWYTGRKRSKHVFQHQVVVCEQLGLTQIDAGMCVHHCDHNPQNNNFDNLVLLSLDEHTQLHKELGRATTISKESTLKWVEAHRAAKAVMI